MKTLFILSAFLFSQSFLFSQPTLTQSNTAPSPGDIFITYDADTSIQPGQSGPNVNWVFNNLHIDTTMNIENFENPSATPYVNAVPGASVAEQISGSYNYMSLVNNDFVLLGQVS